VSARSTKGACGAVQMSLRPFKVQGSIRDIRVIRISNSYFKIVNPIASD
jgi:hypothetical protein